MFYYLSIYYLIHKTVIATNINHKATVFMELIETRVTMAITKAKVNSIN
jgi:hypothetical protein